MDRETLRTIYGDEATQSDYSLKHLILNTTPDKITIFSRSKTAVSQGLLLMAKVILATGDPNSGIFEVRAKGFKGFQYGRPMSPPKHLNVELFPEDGHLDLIFEENGTGPTSISQADINRVSEIWHECLAKYGGPFLFGKTPVLADAMYAPVVTRFLTYDVKLDPVGAGYCKTVMAFPAMREWVAAAKTEPDEVEELDVEF